MNRRMEGMAKSCTHQLHAYFISQNVPPQHCAGSIDVTEVKCPKQASVYYSMATGASAPTCDATCVCGRQTRAKSFAIMQS